MAVINLTPHAITLRAGEREEVFPASGNIARVQQVTVDTFFTVSGFPVHKSTFGEVEMPEPVKGTVYIVSGMVLTALGGTRSDVIAPKTDGTAIRNEAGHIVAVTGWLM